MGIWGAPGPQNNSVSPLHPNYSLGVVVAILGVDIKLLTLRGDQRKMVISGRLPFDSKLGYTKDMALTPTAHSAPLSLNTCRSIFGPICLGGPIHLAAPGATPEFPSHLTQDTRHFPWTEASRTHTSS